MTDSPEVHKPAADPLVGRTVAQYDIVAKLGGGGMGVVYTARDTKLGRLVALKFLPPQWSHDETAKQRFIREAQAASATDHRNICTIHNIESTDDGRLFIVMAHYEGETLKQKLEAGPLAVEEALEIAAQVAEGLAKAHAQGVVHRDIKPGNLMITEDCVKILDFGLAKFADSLQLTIVGSTLGTVAYMSPEQARGEDADVRSDIWALGVVLYEMLTGQVPFKGAYAEAISYAIRSDPPPPLGGSGRAIPESVERLVLRALEKDPTQRFQSAREMVRDLRLLQGRSIPLDLRTEPLPLLPGTAQATLDSRRRARKRLALACAAVLVAAIASTYLWLIWPVERIPVAIAPVANQTGYPELDGYRLALTQTLVGELRESPNIRVLPYDRLLQILRRFLLNRVDISSREALEALTTHSAARFVIVPTLVYENGAWRARAEFRSAETATNAAVYETDPSVSSLPKDTAYGLMASLAEGIQDYFKASGPRRVVVVDAIRSIAGYRSPPIAPRLRTLDAATAFEQGIRAYEDLEYSAALQSFVRAAEQDSRNPLPFAWQSRVARLMRRDDEAAKAAEQALRLLTPEPRGSEELFTAAVLAESRRDFATADSRYRELVARRPDEPAWIAELAGFLDRRSRTAEAIDAYHQALRLDSRLVRPHLELCRLYSPSRLNEPANAKERGRLALSKYRDLGSPAGEAQALWCLTDVLRVGGDEERREATGNAEAALKIFEDLRYPYNLVRAHYYVALAAEAQGNLTEAVAFWEKSLAGARDVGNAQLEPLVLMNLGVMSGRLGNRSRAADYYQQSYMLYEALGDEQRAAQIQANRAEVLIAYGGSPDEGLRDIKNALAVSQKLDDKNFEVFCLQILAAYYRNAGRHADAERELNRALALARERNLDDEIASLTIDRARSRFDMSDYEEGRKLLLQALADESGPDSTEARIRLGQTYVRLGDFASAQTYFNTASSDFRGRTDSELFPLLHVAMGELAYESNRLPEARTHFEQADALWTGNLTDAASVEARAYLGLLDALEGKSARGRTAVQSSLEQARKMGRFSLEVQCRAYLARIFVSERKFEDALRVLNEIPADTAERAIGAELRAQVHDWRSQALTGRGDRAGAQTDADTGRKLIDSLIGSVPQQFRRGFGARRDIRPLVE